jgi:hypothetical protein
MDQLAVPLLSVIHIEATFAITAQAWQKVASNVFDLAMVDWRNRMKLLIS